MNGKNGFFFGRSPVRNYEVLHYYRGGTFYQAKYRGSTLKYVATKPKTWRT
jgi:hypothetical protein